ncbi:MAG: tetratricopeptide repeat protein [Spirochaetaceae bacterium]|nr:tetratricopeptide repeat protein [Myxococcales bacterium]MCB9723440.1 tetratricopeptide repeat protein [Spirochaetaceae bacterium]HPG28254.1 tetratricopeptide repeat protein [Myxococcota bacterium]
MRRLAWLSAWVLLGTTGCAHYDVSDKDDAVVPESVAKRELGIDYLSSFRTAMAIRELNASLELDPSDPRTHLWLGEAYRRKGQTARAEGFLRDAVELSVAQKETATEHDARLNLSALLSQVGRYEDAIEHCEVLSRDATFASPWRPLNNCGWALMKLGRLEEARTHFVEALEFFPRYGPALLNLGILESGQGHRLAAIRAFEQAIESGRLGGGGLAEANYRLGEIFVALGRRDRAIRHFRAAVEEAPEADWASQSQAYLDLLR